MSDEDEIQKMLCAVCHTPPTKLLSEGIFACACENLRRIKGTRDAAPPDSCSLAELITARGSGEPLLSQRPDGGKACDRALSAVLPFPIQPKEPT